MNHKFLIKEFNKVSAGFVKDPKFSYALLKSYPHYEGAKMAVREILLDNPDKELHIVEIFYK